MSFFFSGDRDKYKFYRNKILHLSRISKRTFYHNYFTQNVCNMKKTWEGINALISHKKGSKAISCIKRPDNSTTAEQLEIPNILNKHFASVGPQLASKIPHSPIHFSQYLPIDSTPSSSFAFNIVLPCEIETEINSLPRNKALGLYSCPVRILKVACQFVSNPLAILLNKSVQSGIYPSKLKHAKIIPVFKNEDESDPNNYRPISLLSVFNRIFEKLMYKRVKSFIDKHEILSKSQYGFRENCSTEHALIDIINKIQLNFDKGLYSCGIFIDLKKAFDTVDHDILSYKLEHYGIRGIVNSWFCSYLKNRRQTTQVGPYISKTEINSCGVPQGSVLGPLLFLLYINDISYSSNQLNFFLFADDTNLLYADKNLRSVEAMVNKELANVSNWLMANKLSLNTKKSNFVIFRPYQKRLDFDVTIKLFDHANNSLIPLERKDYVKYLGILIDSNLTWKQHILFISSKISKSLGILSRLRHFVPTDTLLSIYRSLIQPYITYGIAVWGQAAQTNWDKLLILQKRALRLIHFAPYRSHAIPLFIQHNILPLNFQYCKSVCTIMHDVSNNILPANISNLFLHQTQVHSYNTRFSETGSLNIKYSRTNQLKDSFSRFGARIWNSIPQSIRVLPKHKFKASLHQLLSHILDLEDTYVDTPTLINKLSNVTWNVT